MRRRRRCPPRSPELWGRYTDEFVASREELRRSFTEWMANQTFHAQARRICNLGDAEFWATADVPDDLRGPEAEWWATKRADHLRGAAFFSTVADFEEEMLAELRAIPLETEADRATMDAYVPLAQRMIELHREQAAAAAAGDRARISELFDNRLDLTHRIDATLGFECMVRLGA